MSGWRQVARKRLLEQRAALPSAQHRQISAQCLAHIKGYLAERPPTEMSLYWPIKSELDCRPLAAELIAAGWQLSVPVINDESRKLEFARWAPGMPMRTGTWNIPVPEKPDWICPQLLLVPLLGFDRHNYRLGYGGGYYDRTLADLPHAHTVGVGMEIGRFDSIHPHALDIPMQCIITEAGLQQTEPQQN